MPDFYNIAAAKGRIVGQGLMGMGQIVSEDIKGRKRVKTEEKEREERKKARQFTKTLSIVNLYTKMGDDLTPEDRMKLYTGALIPMLTKAGGLPEGTKKEDVSQFIGSLAAHSKEAVQGFREDNNKLLELVNDGKYKEAEKFLAGMTIEYGKLPGAKTFLDHAKTLLKEEKAYARSKAGKEEERKYETTKGIKKGVLAGDLQRVPPGQKGKGVFAGGPVVDYGERGGLVAGLSETQKTERAVEKAGAIAKVKEKPREITFTHLGTGAEKKVIEGSPQYTDLKEDINYEEATYPASRFKAEKIEKPEVKESTAIKEMEAIKKGIDRYETTGGLTGELFTMLASLNKELSKELKGMPHEDAIAFMKKRYDYLFDNFVSEEKKTKYGFTKFEIEGTEQDWRQYQ